MILIIGFGVIMAFRYYRMVFAPNVQIDGDEDFTVYIPSETVFQQLIDTLTTHDLLRDVEGFIWVAQKKHYAENIKGGRYIIKDGWNNNQLVNKLRSGKQDAIKLILNNIESVYELSGNLAKSLEGDSLDFLNYLQDEYHLKELGLSKATSILYFLPNTYEFYWNSSPQVVMERMRKEYTFFWTEERRNKAENIGLKPEEVVVLASIVEKETVQKDEMAKVAGLYMNRLKRNMKLQSDPTVIYGINQDYPERRITRVLYKDLEYNSPYNTYLYKGLPPGPIKIPELHTIDAVLNYEKHDYIYMVADPQRPGYHNFAKTHAGHRQNSRKYHRWVRNL